VRDASFVPVRDEQQMWVEATRFDEAVAARGLSHDDPVLQTYLQGVADRLLPQLQAPGVRTRVIVLRNPFVNAFALPNGSVYVHSGMLARLDNEAQLAVVLGHELTHFLHRHAAQQARAAEHRRVTADVLVGVLAMATTGSVDSARALADLADATMVRAMVTGYARDLEREADRESLRALIGAGYEPREATRVFDILRTDLAEAGVEEPYMFGSHPRLEGRAESYEDLVAGWSAPPGSDARLGRDEFSAAVSGLLLENARLDLLLLRPARAMRAVDRHLAHEPASARGLFMRGESEPAAIAAYESAVRSDPSYAEAYRELGLLYRAQGRRREASDALARYVELAPNAADVPIVRTYVTEPRANQGR
jgi:predicted Zn-dependent protease